MFRRFAIVWVLLLGLSGVVPAGMACAFMMQAADCCPDEAPPCDPTQMPDAPLASASACCFTAPAPAHTVVASAQAERRVHDAPVPDHSAAPAHEYPDARARARSATAVTAAASPQIDQQQIYLRTGRLRL